MASVVMGALVWGGYQVLGSWFEERILEAMHRLGTAHWARYVCLCRIGSGC